MPDNSYFETLSYKIENTINLIPSVAKISEKKTLSNSVKQFFTYILKPQIAVTSTAIVSLLVFATLTFTQHKEANTPYNFSKITNEKIDIQDSKKTIKDIITTTDTASNKDLYFKKELNSPKKDAALDHDNMETAKK